MSGFVAGCLGHSTSNDHSPSGAIGLSGCGARWDGDRKVLAHPVRNHRETGRAGLIGLQGHRANGAVLRSEEHTSELQSLAYLVCRLLLEKKKNKDCTSLLYILFCFFF